MTDDLLERPPLTRGQLAGAVRELGVEPGDIVMLHCSLSSMGYVVGGADTVVAGLLDATAPDGTIVALAGWEHDSYELDRWPEALRRAYLADPPAFDPAISEAARYVGRLPERVRTWPGAAASSHPEARLVAVGARAAWLTEVQPRDHPYGPDSPLARLLEADGRILLLGAPLNTMTLLHHAEELARSPHKKIVHYRAPVSTSDGVEWIEIEDIETSHGAFPYEEVVGDRDSFDVIGGDALAAGVGSQGTVGQATSYLFPARALVSFAVEWLEKNFS